MESNKEIYKDKYYKYKNKYLEQKESSFESLLSIPNNSYPLVEPFYKNFLDVGSSHKLYYEQYGNISPVPRADHRQHPRGLEEEQAHVRHYA